jgi:hypothetical protein
LDLGEEEFVEKAMKKAENLNLWGELALDSASKEANVADNDTHLSTCSPVSRVFDSIGDVGDRKEHIDFFEEVRAVAFRRGRHSMD